MKSGCRSGGFLPSGVTGRLSIK
jgi:hypothetical protein